MVAATTPMANPEESGKFASSSAQKSPYLKSLWSSVVQNNFNFPKFDLNISTEEDGSQVIQIPDEIFSDALPLWEDFLVGKFLDEAPHVAKVHVIVNKYGLSETKLQELMRMP